MQRIGDINAIIIDFGDDIFAHRDHLVFGLVQYFFAIAYQYLYEVQYVALFVCEGLRYRRCCNDCLRIFLTCFLRLGLLSLFCFFAFLSVIGCLFAYLCHFACQHIFGHGEQRRCVFDIYLSFDNIWDNCYRAHDLQYHLRASGRVILRLFHQQLCLETDKIVLISLQKIFQVRCVSALCEAIGVFSLW